MKGLYGFVLVLFAGGLVYSSYAQAEADSHKVHHLVIVWLKQAGDEAARKQYIAASKSLAELPGVLAYDLGTPAAIQRGRVNPAVDESYDVAVSSVYESRQAYEAFLQNPEYQRVAMQVLRPLVEKYQVFDFVE